MYEFVQDTLTTTRHRSMLTGHEDRSRCCTLHTNWITVASVNNICEYLHEHPVWTWVRCGHLKILRKPISYRQTPFVENQNSIGYALHGGLNTALVTYFFSRFTGSSVLSAGSSVLPAGSSQCVVWWIHCIVYCMNNQFFWLHVKSCFGGLLSDGQNFSNELSFVRWNSSLQSF